MSAIFFRVKIRAGTSRQAWCIQTRPQHLVQVSMLTTEVCFISWADFSTVGLENTSFRDCLVGLSDATHIQSVPLVSCKENSLPPFFILCLHNSFAFYCLLALRESLTIQHLGFEVL